MGTSDELPAFSVSVVFSAGRAQHVVCFCFDGCIFIAFGVKLHNNTHECWWNCMSSLLWSKYCFRLRCMPVICLPDTAPLAPSYADNVAEYSQVNIREGCWSYIVSIVQLKYGSRGRGAKRVKLCEKSTPFAKCTVWEIYSYTNKKSVVCLVCAHCDIGHMSI